MKPLEAVSEIRLANYYLIEKHFHDRATYGYYEGDEKTRGMLSLLNDGPSICDKDRHAQEMWVLAWVHENAVAFYKTEIGDDIALPPIFAEVEAMLKDGHDGAAPDGS